jgi:hypothetical protein
MARSSKPVIMLEGHRTKAEKEIRAQAEDELLTGEAWKEYPEVKGNAMAHKFFKRLTDLYSRIEKNDAMTEPIINRYCMMQAECYDFEAKREKFNSNLDALMDDDELDRETKYKLEAQMQQSIISVDKQIMSKRKMLLDIERETLMTLKAQLSSIPKKKEEKPAQNKFTVIGNG